MAPTLLQRVAQNDSAAVQAVLDQFGGLVWSLARRFSLGQSDAEDVVQEIFLDVWKSAPRYDPGVASEATFIAMIARRRLIDRVRKTTRHPRPQTIEELPIAAAVPTSRAELTEEAAQAAQVLSSLTVDQQRVLRLSIYQGMSHEEISQATGLPLGTVKTHSRRGLIRIREVLEENQRNPALTPRRPL